jgi:hypothetical protein
MLERRTQARALCDFPLFYPQDQQLQKTPKKVLYCSAPLPGQTPKVALIEVITIGVAISQSHFRFVANCDDSDVGHVPERDPHRHLERSQ